MALFIKLALAIIIAIFVFLIEQHKDQTSTLTFSNLTLGSGGYDMVVLDAPVARSTLLSVFGWIIAGTYIHACCGLYIYIFCILLYII